MNESPEVGRTPTGGAGLALGGSTPGYAVLLDEIRRRIRSGDWKPDTRIPSERELCDAYGVSRTLVRQALALGEAEGLLVRVPGKGTFVATPRIVQDLSRTTTFRTTLADLKLAPVRRVLDSAWERPSADVAKQLRIDGAATVLVLHVLGMAGELPIGLYQSYIPAAIAEASRLEERVASRELAGARSSSEIVACALGIPELVADQLYEAVAVDDRSARLLQVAPGAPSLKVSTLFSTPDGTPVETGIALYPGDRYGFQIRRTLPIDTGLGTPAG